MTYLGDGEASAVLRVRDGQPGIDLGAMTVTVIAPPALTAGRYSLYRLDLAPEGGGAAPHFHREFAESFLVLTGVVQLFDGRTWVDAAEGDHLYVPEGGVHGFRNERPEAATLLMMSTPAAPREEYFAELARVAASGEKPSAAEWTRLYARHDQYMV